MALAVIVAVVAVYGICGAAAFAVEWADRRGWVAGWPRPAVWTAQRLVRLYHWEGK